MFISFLIEDVQPASARGELSGTLLGDFTPGEVEPRGAWLAEVCRVTGSSEPVVPPPMLSHFSLLKTTTKIFFNLFFGCVGSSLLRGFFSSCDEQGLLSS